jgi:hypothetical protein
MNRLNRSTDGRFFTENILLYKTVLKLMDPNLVNQ